MKIFTKSPMTLVMLAIFVVMVGVATSYPEGARFLPLRHWACRRSRSAFCRSSLDVRAANERPRQGPSETKWKWPKSGCGRPRAGR